MTEDKNNSGDKHGPRSLARIAAVQALYQMEISGRGAPTVIEEFVHHRFQNDADGEDLAGADEVFFADLLHGVIAHQTEIDQSVNGTLAKGWRMERLDSIARALLRTATYELLGRADVPPKVIINEYLDVAHAFLPEEEVKFINGALDSLARSKHRLEPKATQGEA